MKFAPTRPQQELLDYLIAHEGPPPSYREMADALGKNSKSGVHRRLHGLRERGQVDFIPGKWRTVKVL